MISFTDDSSEIKVLLSEIPNCQVKEFKEGKVGDDFEKVFKNATNDNTASLTEPNDSPFRVRRLSRSFSIPNGGVKSSSNCEKLSEEEILLSAGNDENRERDNNLEKTKTKFILLRRSRSLGHIFLPDLPKKSTESAVVDNNIEKCAVDDVSSLTEKVEALEIEVLPSENCDEESQTVLYEKVPNIERPQTSPPILNNKNKNFKLETEEPIAKLSILDRMQKSIGFLFKCARKDENSSEEEYNLTNNLKYPMRSRTPDAKFERIIKLKKERGNEAIIKTEITTKPPVDIPMQAVNFITKVDEGPPKCGDIVKKLPKFYDISGPKGPLLQPQCTLNEGRKCLVLDLDETLVHSSFHVPEAHDLVVTLGLPDGSSQNIYVAKRPGVDEFLARMSELFELVIFTASLAHYADPVIDFLTHGMNLHLNEPRDIKLRLYRESCLFLRGLYVKDLSRLGRKLEQTVIVDNSPASFLLQPDHGIPIKSWFSDANDRELAALHEALKHLADSESVAEWRSKLSSV